MKKLVEKVELAKIKLDVAMKNFMEEERGDFGVKQIAIAIAVIILIGAAVSFLKGNIGTMVEGVWDWLFEQIQNITNA